MREIAGAFK